MMGYNYNAWYNVTENERRIKEWRYARVSLNGSDKVGTVHGVTIERSVVHLDVVWDGDGAESETTSEYVIRTGEYDRPPF